MVLPGAVETARLPAEYQEVEYIQSSGTQYIVTDAVLTNNSKYEIGVTLLATPTAPSALFGSRTNGSANSNNIGIAVGTDTSIAVDFNNSNYATYRASISATLGQRYKIVADKNMRAIYDENGNLLASNTAVCTDTITTAAVSFFTQTGAPTSWEKAKAIITPTKIWENNELKYEFIPCYRKADNVAGLYEFVNGKFYTNAGTGSFIVGPNVGGAVSGGNADFSYTGNYTDNRVNGKGTVRLNSSGIMVVDEAVTVTANIVGADGGGAYIVSTVNDGAYGASGGDGGKQTINVTLEAGTYEIVIGAAGTAYYGGTAQGTYYGTDGGDTSAFGTTSTGGKKGGLTAGGGGTMTYYIGSAGSPNGAAGEKFVGISPTVAASKCAGAAGYVELTFI